MKKILLVSSAGGHFSELQKIKIDQKYKKIIVTEKIKNKENKNVDYYLMYGSRNQLFKYFFVFIFNFFKTLKIMLKEKPDMVISTGAHSSVAFFIVAKIMGKKNIYIESFAKVNNPSLTYKLSRKFLDVVIVQHKTMLDIYENSIYFGGLY